MPMSYIWIGLVGGALSFVHCLGMCGGFSLYMSRGGNPRSSLGRQLLWHAGRVFTYVFLGALAGFGGGLVHSLSAFSYAQNILSYAAGAVIILMGLGLIGVPTPFRPRPSARREEGLLASVFRHFIDPPSSTGALALGLATGFLPCPIVLAFLAYSANTGSVAAGMIVMAAMGLGTLWSLLLLGMTGHMINQRLRQWGAVAAGAVLVLAGLTTILRGTEVFHRVLGCPGHAEHASAAQEPGCSCCEAARQKDAPASPEP